MNLLPPKKQQNDDPALHALLIEDSEIDAELILLQLTRGGYVVVHERIETNVQMKAALEKKTWDVVISDYSLPGFSAPEALEILNESGLDIPFIVVSGKIGEETAVSLMKSGAHDYLKKDTLTRLVQVVKREISEAQMRREKKETQTALMESEQRFRTLTELLPVGVYLADNAGKCLYANQKWLDVAGQTMEEALGDGWQNALHPDDREMVHLAWNKMIESRGKWGLEYRYRNPEGQITLILGLAKLICDDQGNQIGYVGANIDITERKKTIEELRKSEGRLLESQRTAHIGNWELDLQTQKIYLADEIFNILGLDRSDTRISLENFVLLVNEGEREKVTKTLRAALYKSKPFDMDVQIARPDGETRYVNARASLIKEPTGKDSKIVGTLQDITRRKEVELENERLMIQFRRQTLEREAVINISSNMRKVQRYFEMLPILAEQSAEMAKAEAGAVVLLDENKLDFAATSGQWKKLQGEHHLACEDILWETIRSNQPTILMTEKEILKARQNNHQIAKILKGIAACSLIPLKAGEITIGLLVTGYRSPQEFTKERIDLLMTIAEIAGNTMQRMRTMEILEQLVTNRTRELSTIYNVVSVLSESVDLEKSLDMVLTQVLVAMEAKFALFSLLDEDKNTVHLVAHKGISPSHKKKVEEIPLENTWEGWIILHGEPLVVPDIAKDPGMLVYEEFSSGIYSYLGAPMHSRGKVTGVLGVIREGKPYNVDDVLLISAIVDHIGLIIENANLHKRAGQLAVIEERSRLARDLHDSATQTLYSAMLFTETSLQLAERGETDSLITNLQRLSQLSQQALREMRLLVYELRPSVLEQDGLIAAIRQRLEMVEKRVGIKEKLVFHEIVPLDPRIEMALYRITLEALNNVLKHASATEVVVELKSEDGKFVLKVKDNGIGFNQVEIAQKGGVGLSSMRERAEALGGLFEISSGVNQGTNITVKIPLQGSLAKKTSIMEKTWS